MLIHQCTPCWVSFFTCCRWSTSKQPFSKSQTKPFRTRLHGVSFCGSWQFFFSATTQGMPRQMFWSNDTPDIFCGAPFCLHAYMPRKGYEAILKHLKLTTSPPLAFKHPFYPVNDLIDALHKHTKALLQSKLVSCLVEFMSVWMNMWTCPGWMFVPQKPHPMGNQYHSSQGVFW